MVGKMFDNIWVLTCALFWHDVTHVRDAHLRTVDMECVLKIFLSSLEWVMNLGCAILIS